jgi:two-component system, chemotaxis family, sensor kinase CheA
MFLAKPTDNPLVDDLTREFLLESEEGLDRMERGLTELEARPADRELLAEIFRSVHTIKGTTGFLGFPRLESMAHAGENLLGRLREGRLVADAEIISGLLALLDRLRGILRSIKSTEGEGEAGLEDKVMIARLEALQRNEALAGCAEIAASAAADADASQAALVPAAPAPRRRKSASRRLAGGHPVAPRREQPSADPGQAGPQGNDSAETPAPEKPEPASASDRASAASSPGPEVAVAPSIPAAPSAPAEPSTTDTTLRVEVELLNRIMNLVGELVLTRNQILQATSADAGFSPLGRRLDMVTADLREAVMKARMQPVSHFFSRFPRLVRDLARSLGKPVRLEMEGQETELDKSLLEAIRDPLTHAIRNAVDHGIEKPDARAAAGKPPEGLVRLRARHESSHVVVEVHDDGAGMNIERLRAKAVDRGLVPAARAAQLSDREVLQMVFLPGFSTAEAVTSISGRGVGMDVVRTNVEAIGGKVEIESNLGRGTILRLRIPLTLAIIPALIVRSRGQNFAIPQSALIELVHLGDEETAGRIEWLENAPLYRLRGRLLPLVFLDRLLRQPAREPGECDIAILNADGRRFGLVVDDLADPEEIVVKPLAAVLRGIHYYAGATTLGNGEMALILHPGAIAQSAGIGITEEAPESALIEFSETGLNDFLLVESGGCERALPLETVIRIERIPRSRIELAGSRSVLRFNEELLSLEGVSEEVADPEAPTTVVVCRDGARQIGLLVSRVLDVAPGSALREAGTATKAPGVALLREHVTGVVQPSSVQGLETGKEQVVFAPEAQP